MWLNTPRRPHEASGTSGQKASLNGAPNMSILDGWWPEAYNGHNGWSIGDEREYANQDEQDWNDAQQLYHLLENEIVPLFYDRDNGIPRKWLTVSKEVDRDSRAGLQHAPHGQGVCDQAVYAVGVCEGVSASRIENRG